MINFLYLFFGIGVASTILNFVHDNSGLSDKPEVFFIMTGIAFVIFCIWAGSLINDIKDAIDAQLKDIHSIDTLTKKKSSYQAQMEEYKEEMKIELLEKYRQFEEALMTSVKDSNIIATIMEKSGYVDVLKQYNNRISTFLDKIHINDRDIQDSIQRMKIRQNNPIYGYSKFIPNHFLYENFYKDESS